MKAAGLVRRLKVRTTEIEVFKWRGAQLSWLPVAYQHWLTF